MLCRGLLPGVLPKPQTTLGPHHMGGKREGVLEDWQVTGCVGQNRQDGHKKEAHVSVGWEAGMQSSDLSLIDDSSDKSFFVKATPTQCQCPNQQKTST